MMCSSSLVSSKSFKSTKTMSVLKLVCGFSLFSRTMVESVQGGDGDGDLIFPREVANRSERFINVSRRPRRRQGVGKLAARRYWIFE